MLTRAARVVAVAIIVFVSALPQTQARAKGVDQNPPSGILPTTVTLQQVLAVNDKAEGKAIDPNAAVIEDDAISTNGLTGTYHAVSYRGTYRTTTTLGPFTTSDGYDGQTTWSEDENGQVVQVQGVHQRGAADARALGDALSHPGNGVKLLGEVTSPVAAYVVEVNPPDGRKEWVFFDKTTGLIDRTERVFPDARVVNTYADFKTRNGRTEAWSGHYSDGDAANDEDWHITGLQIKPQIDQSEVAEPASRTFVEFPAGATSVKLPARILDGRITVTLTIGGKGYDFLLDSGSSDINVDWAAAQQMGLKPYGKSVGDAAGKFTSSESVIPEADVGDLKMHDVAVTILPYTEQPAEGTELVGLLGYDFIAGAELSIDYDNKSVTALTPRQYVPSPQALVIPAALDDRIPVVAAQIGQAFGDHFIIDTGADLGYIFPGFVAAHPHDVADKGGGASVSAYEPFMYSEGVGGETRLKPTEVGVFQIGGVRFEDWMVYTMPENTVQQDEDFDGLIGYDFLRYFTVVFDYADEQIYLEPNDLFRRSATKK